MGTLPNAKNDFRLKLSWPTGKLPIVTGGKGLTPTIGLKILNSGLDNAWVP